MPEVDITDAGTATDAAWAAVRAVQDGINDSVWSLGLVPDATVTATPDQWYSDPMGTWAGYADHAVWAFLDVVWSVSGWLHPLLSG